MERTAAAPRTGPLAALTPARRGAANATRADAAVGAPGGGGAASTTGGTVAASSTRGDAAPTTRENGAALTTRSPATAGPAAASTLRENAAATTRGNTAALRALSSATGTAPAPYTTPRSYTLTLTLPPSTVSALAAGGFRLCLMHAVRCDTADGVPLVWATTTEYATATSLNWAAEPYGYAATSRTADGSPGGARDMRPVALGRVLDVGANALTSINPLPGDPRYVTARSTAPAPMVCGAAEHAPVGPGAPAPYCCFPLHGGAFVFFTPLPQVALAFTALPLTAGTAVRHLPGPTVLVDVGGGGRVELGYDIDAGWSWQDPNVIPVPLNGLTRALVVPTG